MPNRNNQCLSCRCFAVVFQGCHATCTACGWTTRPTALNWRGRLCLFFHRLGTKPFMQTNGRPNLRTTLFEIEPHESRDGHYWIVRALDRKRVGHLPGLRRAAELAAAIERPKPLPNELLTDEQRRAAKVDRVNAIVERHLESSRLVQSGKGIEKRGIA